MQTSVHITSHWSRPGQSAHPRGVENNLVTWTPALSALCFQDALGEPAVLNITRMFKRFAAINQGTNNSTPAHDTKARTGEGGDSPVS
jgi:hypothetical protein